jgi:hypothetical protein
MSQGRHLSPATCIVWQRTVMTHDEFVISQGGHGRIHIVHVED